MNGICHRINYLSKPFFFLVLILISTHTFSQSFTEQDTSLKISKGSYLRMKDIKSFIPRDTVIIVPATLIMAGNTRNEKTVTFYDSLKSKASRSKLTRALFDLVIVSPDSSDKRKIFTRTEDNFNEYSGIRINSILFKRLNVFGADIENPGLYSPGSLERLLNSTHVNTNESIIRKYLLFHEGDTISPLRLADNERVIRQLPFINDARILVIPVSSETADIVIITKDVYSLGADFTYRSKKSGSFWFFEKNIFGMGHEFKLEIPYSSQTGDSPGIGLDYYMNNLFKSFINLNVNYYNGLGKETYGFNLVRNLISTETKYAGGISVSQTNTSEDLDTLISPEPLSYNFQDYWLLRSFLLSRESAARLIVGIRYTNNNVFEKPLIKPDTYYALQRYRLLMSSLSFSMQKYYKTNLIYSYGRTEDIPYGTLLTLTGGLEINEFKRRQYIGANAAFGFSFESLGYLNFSGGIGTFINEKKTEQGVSSLRLQYFSNLLSAGSLLIRNFVNINYTRGFGRYEDEYLTLRRENGFSGFRNDSLKASQRITAGIETVVFNPLNFYGFRIAIFGFADMALLAGTKEAIRDDVFLSALGIGLRLRNDNLVFSTFQVKIGFFPSPPPYSRTNHLIISGEQLLRPKNFDPGAPSTLNYR